MLTVVTNDGMEYDWHVGELTGLDYDRIKEIEADGHELEYVRNLFSPAHSSTPLRPITIPFSTCRVQRWFGDMAKTIYAALGG